MKNLMIILLLMSSKLFFAQSALLPNATTLEQMNIFGKVTQVGEKYYKATNDGAKEAKPGETITFNFNPKGQIIKTTKTFSHQFGKYDRFYTYDNDGNVIKDSDGVIHKEYTYKKLGNLVVRSEVNNSDPKVYHELKYDKNKIIEWNIFSGQSEPNLSSKYSYNKKNQIIEETTLSNIIIYTFDSNGNIIKEIHTKLKTGEHYKTIENTYDYDKNNNWISRKQTVRFYDSKEASVVNFVERTYSF